MSSFQNGSGAGPWGNSPGGGHRGGGSPWGSGGGGQRPPNMEQAIRDGQQRLKKLLPGGLGGRGILMLALLVVAVWLATGFYKVEPEEQGVELVFGKLYEVTPAGLQYNFPSPIGQVLKPKVTAVNQVEVGFRSAVPGQRGRNVSRDITAESLMLTGDENIIDVQFTVFWVIDDAEKFLFNVRNAEQTVKDAAEAAMREVVGKTDFQYARTNGRGPIAAQTRDLLQSVLDGYGSGIRVTEVNVRKVDPPGAVMDAFRDVQAARADKERAINEATAYLNEVTERAQGQAEQVTQAAEAYKQEKIAQAEGDASRFLEVYNEYKNAKSITKRRIYLQTMEEILQGMDKMVIENGSGVLPWLPLDKLKGDITGKGGQ